MYPCITEYEVPYLVSITRGKGYPSKSSSLLTYILCTAILLHHSCSSFLSSFFLISSSWFKGNVPTSWTYRGWQNLCGWYYCHLCTNRLYLLSCNNHHSTIFTFNVGNSWFTGLHLHVLYVTIHHNIVKSTGHFCFFFIFAESKFNLD